MGKKDFKPRHMRSATIDDDGNEMVHHTIQVGPSSFIADKNPPDGHCDNCGVEIDARHFQEVQNRLARYESEFGELAEEQADAENAEEIAHLDDEADLVGTSDPEPYDVVGSEF